MLKPSNVTCTEGETVTLYARVASDTVPVVNWYKGLKELEQSARFMKRYNGNEYALTISNITTAERGEYIVSAKNTSGTTETRCHIVVHSSFSK